MRLQTKLPLLLLLIWVLLLLVSHQIPSGAAQQQAPKKKAPVRVAIVGGGIAGCAAAWHLKQTLGADVAVKIIEADMRLGGRIFSVGIPAASGNGKSFIELGANWIHGEEGNPLFEFA